MSLSVDSLIERLRDSDVRTRCLAARDLGKTRQTIAVKPLGTALQDDEPAVRMAAARALGELGHPEAVPLLIAAFRDTDRDVCKASVRALKSLGAHRALVDALEQAGEAAPMVEALLTGVAEAADGLVRMGDPETVGPLFATVRNPGFAKIPTGKAAIHTLERMADAVKEAASGGDPKAKDALAWLVKRQFDESSARLKTAERMEKQVQGQVWDRGSEDDLMHTRMRIGEQLRYAHDARAAAEDLLLRLWETGDPRATALADSFDLDLNTVRAEKEQVANKERQETERREREKAAQERREAENRRLREKWGGRLPP